MADRIITIDIDKEKGTFTVDTEGFHGTGCSAIHDAFNDMGAVTSETKKPEYFGTQGNGNRVTAGR